MRVLVLTHNYPRFPGDPAGAFVRRLAVAAAGRGARVAVVCPWAPNTAASADDDGVLVRRFRYPGDERAPLAYTGELHRRAARAPTVALRVPFFLARFGQMLRRVEQDLSPDVIHAHWWLPAGWLASRTSRPYLVTCHGSDVRVLEHWRILRPLARRVLARAGGVTTVSRFLADDLAALVSPARATVAALPMPVDVELFARGRAIAKADPPRVLYAGNLLPSKGVDVLVDAVALLRDRQVPCRLRILGQGPAEAALRARADRSGVSHLIEWSRFVPQAALVDEYGAATVTVLPTRGRAEGLGLTLVEALLAGSAVVGSAVGGIPEVVEHDQTGLLFPDGDAAALAQALERMLRDAELRRRLTIEGARRMADHYAPAAAAQRFMDLYRVVADGRARAER